MIFQSSIYIILATLIYSCCIADTKTSTVSRFVNRTIPTWIMRNIERGSLQLVYLVVVLGSWTIIFTYGYPAIDSSNHIDSRHKYAGYAVFFMCMTSWLYASNTCPGNVTAETMQLFDHYEYDNVLYKNRECPTLKIRKIARSKYDRYTKRHVPRFDHFCGWINQAVGEQNYRWFLLFLVYGSWAMGTLLYGEVIDHDLLNTTFHNEILCSLFQCGGEEGKASYVIILHHLIRSHMQIVGVLLLMLFIVVCLGIFTAFHLYISSRNMTTNEYYKWKELRKKHDKMTDRYLQALKDGTVQIGKRKRDASASNESSSDVDVGCMGPIGDAARSEATDEEIYDPGPMPKNMYDKGIINNFAEIMRPLSFRQGAKLSSLKQNGSNCHANATDATKSKKFQ
ncbi:hypothetical protein ACHAWO_010200 [Cyclotella atomus]|uniref:Palmitoyltransferase n=1 Tax=Cyclotella atomus TaxID=382360 RepID=A0ABD3PJQ1_9STRA